MTIEPCDFGVGFDVRASADVYNICHKAYILRGGWTEEQVRSVFKGGDFGDAMRFVYLGSAGYYVYSINSWDNTFSSQRGLSALLTNMKKSNLTARLLFSEARILRSLTCTYAGLFKKTLLRKLLHLYIGALKPTFEAAESYLPLETTFTLCYYPHSGAWADDKYRIVLSPNRTVNKK